MPTFRWSDLASEAIDPEHSAATGRVYRGEQIEVALVRYPAGSRVTPHASPHEQVHSILKGRARFRVGTEEKIIGPGEAVLVRSGVQHAAEILVMDDGAIADRGTHEELLASSAVYREIVASQVREEAV